MKFPAGSFWLTSFLPAENEGLRCDVDVDDEDYYEEMGDLPDLSPRRISPIEVTNENIDRLLIDYFSVDPYTVILPHKDDKKRNGTPASMRVPCDVPTLDGFSAAYNIAKSRIERMISPETIEICLAKFKHIMMVNGTAGLYNPGFSGLMMKNEAGWAEKSEVKTMSKRPVTITDKILEMLTTEQLEQIRMEILAGKMVTIDDTANNS